MIPSIPEILAGLQAGGITLAQAWLWVEQHLQAAREAGTVQATNTYTLNVPALDRIADLLERVEGGGSVEGDGHAS